MSFACPNGTLFSQSSRICNSQDNVYCQLSERYYDNVQGNIDTQGDYKATFHVTHQPVFPLEPRRPAAKRPSQQQDDDYEEEPATAAPRRPQANRRQPPARPQTTTTTTAPPRQRPPVRQFQPQIPPQLPIAQFNPQGFQPQDARPPAGSFLPPRANSRLPPSPLRPQLVAGVTQSPIEYSAPQRPGVGPPNPFIPGPPASQAPTAQTVAPQAPNRLTVPNRPTNARRPNPLSGAPTTTTSAPSTTADPNAEYEYYDYEEPAEGGQQSSGKNQ